MTIYGYRTGMAPGLIRGSLKVKLLVPQSSIPGMFILLLPWLYCPLVWAIYNLVYQLVGNVVLMAGLLILAFTPMAYFVVGSVLHVSKPNVYFTYKLWQLLTIQIL